MADKIKPFEKIFPYLSYRWRYDDGEYSPYAPFTEVQFLAIQTIDDNERYENGFNVFMTNDTDEIRITSLPTGREDVVAVDILYTESIATTIYVLKTIELSLEQRRSSYISDIKVSKRGIGSALPNDQLNRPFDNVPLQAQAQEITANRLMYGNYLHKFKQGAEELGGQGFQMSVGVEPDTSSKNGPSVKTNRTYEVGVVYLDKYGRYGGLLTQLESVENSSGSSITTDFTYRSRIKLKATITSKAPSWATHYRYYIKDTSNNFYNLTSFNTYIDGGEGDEDQANAYIQFDSRDRNKIDEESFLIPRRSTHESDLFSPDAKVLSELYRLPILDIENEAPDVVKAQVVERNIADIGGVVGNVADFTDASGNADQSTLGQTVFYIKDKDIPFALSGLNSHITSQGGNALVNGTDAGLATQTVDTSAFTEKLILKFNGSNSAYAFAHTTDLVLVDEIQFISIGGASRRNLLKFTVSKRVSSDGGVISGTGLSKAGVKLNPVPWARVTLKFYKLALTEDGANKLKGSFFVKVPRKFSNPDPLSEFTSIPIGQTSFDENGNPTRLRSLDFETDGDEDSNLDLYWESASTFSIAEHGQPNVINWSNCIASLAGFPGKIYIESINMLDKFNATSLVKSIRVNTPEPRYTQERRKSGIIFSGIYNSKTGINELNQFNMSLNPTKELEPNYGGIQKMFALDTNLLTLTEDKVFKVLADKDALFNADESVNLIATPNVLGQAMTYQGNYGISTHPESFIFFGNNAYFTDAKRGVVMQLTPANGQLFPISSVGMANFFRDRIGTADKLIGAYDGTKKQYVLSMQGYDPNAASIGSETIPNETSDITLGYSLRGQGWTSRYSFIPESGITMNNKFYTFKNGNAYLHNSDTALRNNFYGTQYNSEVEIIFNDNPTYVSDFLTLNYEGDSGWEAIELIGDQDGTHSITNVRILDSEESGFLGWFLKEGKYHGAIVGTQPTYIIDPNGTVGADGFWPLIQDGANTQDISGTKGFFLKTRFKTSETTAKELFAISSEYYISQT